ncbi:hypothetical protein TcCL_Unassigned03397 [Trypanosoma cruzi]|nr:hypothetical protein TcCL_Unassigned03397 [Trypanosoma cruzi]
MDAAKRHSQSTWPVSMPPLHAGTQEKLVRGEKSKKQHNTQKKQTTGGKSTATALVLAGNSTPVLNYTHTHHRSAVSPRVRGLGPPPNKRTHRQRSPTMDEEERHTATASSSIPRPTR